MSVSDGQPVSAAVTNAAYLSKLNDGETTGVITLKNTTDVNSGAQVTNTQRAVNETFDAVGMTGEGDATRKNYSSNNVVADGDSHKVAIGKIDAAHQAHLVDTADAHAGSAITNTPAGSIAATTVQAAINELDGDITGHVGDTTDAHAGTAITNTPSGNLAATTVQAALNELQGDIDGLPSASSTTTFTNKTFDDELRVKEIATPSTPSSGYRKLYPKTDGWYDLDSAGAEVKVGTGAGGGGINYITNSDFETNADGWTAYDDGASAVPVDATGGSPTSTFARNTTTALRGTGDGKFTIAINSQGEGVATSIEVEPVDVGKTISIGFEYKTDSDYITGDVGVYMVSTTAGVVKIGDIEKKDATPYGKFNGYYTVRADETHKLVFHCQTNNAAATDLYLDTVTVSPMTFPSVQVVEQQNWVVEQANNAFTDRTGHIRFNLAGTITITKDGLASTGTAIQETSNTIYAVDDAGGQTKFVASKNCKVTVSSLTPLTTAGNYSYIYKNGSAVLRSMSSRGTNEETTVVGTITLNAGDYFTVFVGSDLPNIASTTILSIKATSTSEQVIQSYESGTEWYNSGAATITGTTSNPTKGTVSVDQLWWKREGGDMLLNWDYYQSAAGAGAIGSGTYLITLPNSASIDTTKVNIGTTLDSMEVNYTKLGTVQLTSGDGGQMNVGTVFGYNSTKIMIILDASITDTGTATANTGESWGSGTYGLNSPKLSVKLNARIPILGWSSVPRLLSLRNSKENVFSARIANSGTPTLTSQSSDWINSVADGGTGITNIFFNKLGLTTIPSITVTPYRASGDTLIATIQAISSTSVTIHTRYIDLGGGTQPFQDHPFEIHLQKQGADYQPPSVFVGNVSKTPVAIVSYAASASSTTVSNTANTATISPLDLAEGDTHIFSTALASNQFTLQAGDYLIEWSLPIHAGASSAVDGSSYLRNATAASIIKYGTNLRVSVPAATSMEIVSNGVARVSISTASAFEIYYRTSAVGGSGTNTIGYGGTTPDNIKTQVKITQLAKY